VAGHVSYTYYCEGYGCYTYDVMAADGCETSKNGTVVPVPTGTSAPLFTFAHVPTGRLHPLIRTSCDLRSLGTANVLVCESPQGFVAWHVSYTYDVACKLHI
jgi:hypothetical protein